MLPAPLSWRIEPLPVTPRQDGRFQTAAAMILAFQQWAATGASPELSCLSLGDLRILNLPGDVFVEYQLFAQTQGSGLQVAVAGYEDCGTWYLPIDATYQDNGGYEQTFAFGEPCQPRLEAAISRLLAGTP